ncbi:hypothetical protein [Leeuwenhoekiella marinoflava]|uniref:Uncharacterized protein n=2 Tax=Leeuwenhoekiella marinoflava TaxID=988 RepID=A0A4Q0P3X0_9FLAO|nr:hypothetical protein [Leeuwenhoekiella marinoflava]RXG21247.1 hypothetical protein DSL99_4052 [Leeuwenhoekiella marinoflava]SHG04992.1 hypothetical protein SAMN02745246_04069 [Leeuwenhoekiella marinoflava DSM 3653]
MKQQINHDWIIDNLNTFDLPLDVALSFSSIQNEIAKELNNKLPQSLSDYLNTEIDVSKEIIGTPHLTIRKVFRQFLSFENIVPSEVNNFKCNYLLNYLKIALFKLYNEGKYKNILNFEEYQKQYGSLLSSFMTLNVDTDEQDFIDAENNICDKLVLELNKPIYNKNPLNELLDKPCEFKKNLINSIDKRKKFLEQKANEKYPKVKALFEFIGYLHSNIENFNQYNGLIDEVETLKKERDQLKPERNYKDKLRFDQIQPKLIDKLDSLQINVINKIRDKAKELNVCNFENEPIYDFSGIETEIYHLKRNFSDKDLPEIFKHKSLYLDYRSQTHSTFLALQIFLNDLDEITKSLFDYFKDTDRNEFEAFETKAIPVNNFTEALQGFKKGQTKFTLPINFLENKKVPAESLPFSELTPKQQKHKIAFDLVGENSPNTTGVVYHHIEEILKKYHLTNEQGKNILLTMRGAFSPAMNKTIIPSIIDYLERVEFIPDISLPEQTTTTKKIIRYKAKHYVLTYLIECNAKDLSFPIGQKKELEQIGSKIMGAGKGNTFYKNFNSIINKYNINNTSHLIEIGGENWRTIVKDISNEPELIETYLQSKQI